MDREREGHGRARRPHVLIDFGGMLFESPSKFPGTPAEVSRGTADGERAVRHAGGAAFLAARPNHPGSGRQVGRGGSGAS
ncbi:hypothetical protein AB0E10_33610 [Streptomyces sp. NPDC048045]|uniref:hypothetical protein n=1 Tax=Streptomyces sp. NPDC048045 TaxID=3154710 RepID=UPI00344436B9